MVYQGLVITGTSGAGKTTLTRSLVRDGAFEQVKAFTTRMSRYGDNGEYTYLSEDEFQLRLNTGKFIINTQYQGKYYGISIEDIYEVNSRGKIPILVISPDSYCEYAKKNSSNFQFMSYFIDEEDDELDRRLAARGDVVTNVVRAQRIEDRNYRDSCLYYIKNVSTEKTIEVLENLWEYRSCGGVLSNRLIKLMIGCGMLLNDANNENVKGASYDLSLGDEYYYKGKIQKLSERDPFLLIEPYDYVIATSTELANFPRDITGRFDLSVSLFCQGIILSNGPCVDPGFRGRLFCLLFNTSNASIYLKRGQHYATLELQKLIEPTTAYSGKYQDKHSIVDYLPSNALQGGISELKKELETLKRDNQTLQTAIASGVAFLLSIISILLVIK